MGVQYVRQLEDHLLKRQFAVTGIVCKHLQNEMVLGDNEFSVAV